MQVILLEKIVNVGNLGDVVKVKDGYARNFLIPQGKAKRATEANLKAIEARRAELEAAAIQVTQKAGVDGRLFGSVTNVDIVDALNAKGFSVEKSMIRMPSGPLK